MGGCEGAVCVLSRAARAALPVAAPGGWGWTLDHRQVLVTAYAGAPVADPTEQHLRRFADVLRQIHATPLAAVGLAGDGAPRGHPVDGIVAAYFPGLATQPDIQAICAALRQCVDATEPSLIHGDFNLGNILLQNGTITVVDWTTMGASDRRYDLAWATVVLWIYQGADAATEFRSHYLAAADYPINEQALGYFEALAGLRWLLLRRQYPLSDGRTSVQSIARFVDDRLPDAFRGDLLELHAPAPSRPPP
jgi:aminoglycoside phosphotransferase (APT) family kinase protein